jgi:hypothetical protein
MKAYQSKVAKLSGTDFKEVHSKALIIYKTIKNRSKRRPYVRTAYFKNDKTIANSKITNNVAEKVTNIFTDNKIAEKNNENTN